MYFDIARSVRLAVIENYHETASLLIESSGRAMTMFSEATRATLRTSDSGAGANREQVYLPNIFFEQLHMVRGMGRNVIRLFESQLRTSSHLVQSSLERAKFASTPLLDLVIDNAELAVSKAAELAGDMAEESVKAIDEIETKVTSRASVG